MQREGDNSAELTDGAHLEDGDIDPNEYTR